MEIGSMKKFKLIIRTSDGKVYKTNLTDTEMSLNKFIDTIKNFKKLNNFYIDTRAGRSYLNPDHIVSMTIKEK